MSPDGVVEERWKKEIMDKVKASLDKFSPIVKKLTLDELNYLSSLLEGQASNIKQLESRNSDLQAEILKLKEINANVDGLKDVISDLQKKLEVAVEWIENLKKSHNPQEGEYHFAICDCIVCQHATEALAKLKE